MRQRRFEEILDDCISAYLQGRRSVEESLSLYPAEARRLEPLLRAAADTFDLFQVLKPPVQTQERIRQRIVRAATERAAARALTRHVNGFGTSARRLSFGRAAMASGLAALVGLLITGGILLPGMLTDEGGSGDSPATTVQNDRTLGSSILNARQSINAIQEKASAGQDIQLRDLSALTGAMRSLTQSADPETLAPTDADQLQEIIEDNISVLGRLETRSTRAEKEQIESALVLTYQLAASLGIDDEATASPPVTAEPTNVPTETPAPTPTQEPTPEPQPSPSPTP